MIAVKLVLLTIVIGAAAAFSPTPADSRTSTKVFSKIAQEYETTRVDFLANIATSSIGFSLLSTLSLHETASARGRATLEQAYDRYTPRIVAGGKFFASDLRKMIEKNDWAGLKAATSDPPKKSKEDRTKVDGGIAERAAQAGGFSAARVLVACELYAAAFSDNAISSKTKKMQKETESLKEVIEGINRASREALGEESSGGLFGFGGKKANPSELAKQVRKLYVDGGNAWNRYIFAANEELPLSLEKLPYLG